MNLTRIGYFVDVVKYNSFTKAAHANYISQTAISQHIAAMEAELGIKLIDRSKKGITITEAGSSFYDNCMQILSLYARSVSVAKCVDQGLSGRITFGVSPGMDNFHIYNAIRELNRMYSDVYLMMRVGTPTELKHMLKTVGINMGVALPYDFYSVPDVTIEPLITCGYDLMVSTESPLSKLDAISVNDIRSEKFVIQGEDIGELTYSHIVIEHMQNIHKLTPTYTVPNFDTLKMMVATNQGIAILPEYTISPDNVKIKRLKLLDYPETVTYSVIWRPSTSSTGIEHFVEILKKYFGELAEEKK